VPSATSAVFNSPRACESGLPIWCVSAASARHPFEGGAEAPRERYPVRDTGARPGPRAREARRRTSSISPAPGTALGHDLAAVGIVDAEALAMPGSASWAAGAHLECARDVNLATGTGLCFTAPPMEG